MRGTDDHQDGLFSDMSLDARVPSTHLLRAVREMVDEECFGWAKGVGPMHMRAAFSLN